MAILEEISLGRKGKVWLHSLREPEQTVAWIRIVTNGVVPGLRFEAREEKCAALLLEMDRMGYSFICETDGVWYFRKRA